MVDTNSGAGAINVGNIVRAFAVLIYVLAAIAGFICLDNVNDAADKDDLVRTCDERKNKGYNGDCTENLNFQWALAWVGTCILLFVIIGILAELRISFVYQHVSYQLSKMTGRGVWQVILALLCLGVAGDLGIACCILGLIFGIIQFFVGFFCEKTVPSQNQQQPANTST